MSTRSLQKPSSALGRARTFRAVVGLIVPHVVRLAVGPGVRALLPLSLCSGAAFLSLCDALARTLVPGRELPVGVLTAALGAPALVVLIARRR